MTNERDPNRRRIALLSVILISGFMYFIGFDMLFTPSAKLEVVDPRKNYVAHKSYSINQHKAWEKFRTTRRLEEKMSSDAAFIERIQHTITPANPL